MAELLAPLPTTVYWEAHFCGECGVPFASSIGFFNERRKTGASFYCPNGHCRVYRDTEEKKLRRELEEARSRLTQAHIARDEQARARVAAEHSARTSRGHLTRLKNKIARGECPACGTTFKNVRRHMRRVHPSFEVDRGT
jgi:uncharacterized Zn finger protein (UPF0148 family)